MTQEELDELMNGSVDDMDSLGDEVMDEVPEEEELEEDIDDGMPAGYSKDTAHHWPLPATEENRMVHQLDDVTKESE